MLGTTYDSLKKTPLSFPYWKSSDSMCFLKEVPSYNADEPHFQQIEALHMLIKTKTLSISHCASGLSQP